MLVGPDRAGWRRRRTAARRRVRRAGRAARAIARSICRSPRALSSSWTRIGTRRSPASNLASAGPTSPMVATRMVCDRLSVETPSRAASSARGSDAQFGPVERGFRDHVGDRSESRFICVASSLATLLTMLLSTPVTTSEIARRPFSSEEPEADVGNVLQLLADLEFELALGDIAVGLRRVVDDQRGARGLHARPAGPGRRRRRCSSPRAACAGGRRCPR